MTIVETRSITGGVDTDLDVHVAAALDANGGVLGVESFPATTVGFAALHSWLIEFGALTRIGVEGTGAYGAGLARFLRRTGVSVIEVDRPNRRARRRAGKSDELDAIEAGRAALSGRASGIAKTTDGNVEAIRVLVVAYRSGRDARIKCLNQIRHLGFTAPDELRERFHGITAATLAGHAAGLRRTSTVTRCCTQRSPRCNSSAGGCSTSMPTLPGSTTSSACSSGRPHRACSSSTESASTPPRCYSPPPVTTPHGSPPKPSSRTSAASRRQPIGGDLSHFGQVSNRCRPLQVHSLYQGGLALCVGAGLLAGERLTPTVREWPPIVGACRIQSVAGWAYSLSLVLPSA